MTKVYLQIIDDIDKLEKDVESLLRDFEERTGLKVQNICIFGNACSEISKVKITIGIS